MTALLALFLPHLTCCAAIQVTAVIASVEDSLGVLSPEDLAALKETEGGGMDQETCRLADGECVCTHSPL